MGFLHVQQHVAFQVALLGKFLSTLLADDWVCVHFLMDHQNVPSEELLGAEGAMKISLSRLVHQDMTQQLYFSLKTLPAQVAQLSRDIWMSSDDVLRQPQLALDHLFAVFAAVFKNLFGLQAVRRFLVGRKVVLVAKHLATKPALKGLLL